MIVLPSIDLMSRKLSAILKEGLSVSSLFFAAILCGVFMLRVYCSFEFIN